MFVCVFFWGGGGGRRGLEVGACVCACVYVCARARVCVYGYLVPSISEI